MSATAEKEARFVFEGLSDPERKTLEEALNAGKAKHLLIAQPKGETAGGAHGELITGTVVVIAAKFAVPLVAGWLLSKAPPKPRKETIQIAFPDGKKITKTIEYSKSTPLQGLTTMLNNAIGRGNAENGGNNTQEPNVGPDSVDV